MKKETHGVLERHARKERTAAFKTGLIIALLLAKCTVIGILLLLYDIIKQKK